jgi:hypothetical protein
MVRAQGVSTCKGRSTCNVTICSNSKDCSVSTLNGILIDEIARRRLPLGTAIYRLIGALRGEALIRYFIMWLFRFAPLAVRNDGSYSGSGTELRIFRLHEIA